VSRLDSLRIVVTRPASKSDALCDRIEALGASVIRAPSIEILDVEGDHAQESLLRALPSCDWVVFTSANGVEAGFRAMERIGVHLSDFDGVRIAAVGPATAAALCDRGLAVAVVPERHVGSSVADVVGPITGRRFLLVRGDLASPALPSRLRAAGGLVDEAVVYRTVASGAGAEVLHSGFDIVTFTSPSTVRSFMTMLGDAAADSLANAAVVTIGPVTSQAAREAGLAVAAEADPHTIDGLIAALAALASISPGSG